MALRWHKLMRTKTGVWEADIAKDSTGREVARVTRRPWPDMGLQWQCVDQSGFAANVTEAKRAAIAA